MIDECPAAEFTLRLRIPGWCEGATLLVNGHAMVGQLPSGTYAAVQRVWQAGDVVELSLPIPVRLMEVSWSAKGSAGNGVFAPPSGGALAWSVNLDSKKLLE